MASSITKKMKNKNKQKSYASRVIQLLLSVVVCIALIQAGKIGIKTAIENRAMSGTVKITRIDNHDTGGTGFLMNTSKGPFIVTNAHICRHLGSPGLGAVFTQDSYEPKLSRVIKISETSDLCIMSPITGLSPLSLGSKPDQFDTLTIFGHPLLEPLTPTEGQLVKEMLVEVGESPEFCDGGTAVQAPLSSGCMRVYNGYLTTVIIYPGNSGSPVFNIYGHVVGVAFASNAVDNRAVVVTYEDLVDFINLVSSQS